MSDFSGSILDKTGKPMRVPEKSVMIEDIAGPTMTGTRSPITGYPSSGLNPQKLGRILRDADQGNPLAFLELAEQIEEKDLHYAGVMGTRKRSVSQLDITVEPGGDKQHHLDHAERVRQWLKRDELTEELFDILDAIGKGFSVTEIIWDLSEKQYQPARLEWRDPRYFRFDRIDGATPVLIGESGQDIPLDNFKFICARMRAKSGIPIRSGIARIVSWAWMFKAFTNRDWTIFTQTYGQPIRVGRYHRGATKEERDTLLRAVANIAGDCAAIVPDGMNITFEQASGVSATGQLYKDRSDHFDQQVSKAVLGQTATTDALAGGHAVGKEHRQVQEDIERADAKAISAILNRDLIRPWMMLEFGPQDAYPRVVVGRPDEKDMKLLGDLITNLVPMGLRAKQSEVRDMMGLSEPKDDDEIFALPAPEATPKPAMLDSEKPKAEQADLQSEQSTDLDPLEYAASQAAETSAALDAELKELVENATSLEDLRDKIAALAKDQDPAEFAERLRDAMLLANLVGRDELGDA